MEKQDREMIEKIITNRIPTYSSVVEVGTTRENSLQTELSQSYLYQSVRGYEATPFLANQDKALLYQVLFGNIAEQRNLKGTYFRGIKQNIIRSFNEQEIGIYYRVLNGSETGKEMFVNVFYNKYPSYATAVYQKSKFMFFVDENKEIQVSQVLQHLPNWFVCTSNEIDVDLLKRISLENDKIIVNCRENQRTVLERVRMELGHEKSIILANGNENKILSLIPKRFAVIA